MIGISGEPISGIPAQDIDFSVSISEGIFLDEEDGRYIIRAIIFLTVFIFLCLLVCLALPSPTTLPSPPITPHHTAYIKSLRPQAIPIWPPIQVTLVSAQTPPMAYWESMER